MDTTSENRGGCFGLVCALPEELGQLAERAANRRRVRGVELLELDLPGGLLACVGGVGKVRSAHAVGVLLAEGATRGVFVVGVCGGLTKTLGPGTLVHCTRAIQTDLAHPNGRECDADAGLLGTWQSVAPGEAATFLTADRPVFSRWRRLRLLGAFGLGRGGAFSADMETAAAAAICEASDVPWAALRAVTDRASGAGIATFKLHYPSQAGRPADTIPSLLQALSPPAPPVAPQREQG
jgi:nucleoside phosphorylase